MHIAQVRRNVIQYARRHGGIITAAEARTCGAESRQLGAMVRDDILRRRYRGVYVLAGAAETHALDIRAALKAMTASDRLHAFAASHASAAWLQGLRDPHPAPAQVHVTTTANHGRGLPGVVVHRSSDAHGPLESRPFQGIPCTVPARTLVDLAASACPSDLADVVDRALAKGLVPVRDIEQELKRYPYRRGTDHLRRCLAGQGYTGVPNPSVLEGRMARLLTRFGLPRAKAQCIAGPNGEYRLDYAYPEARLMTELYGYTWHHSPEQMASDLARQRRLTLEGWTPLIFTWQDVTDEPGRVAEEMRRALYGGAAPGRTRHPA